MRKEVSEDGEGVRKVERRRKRGEVGERSSSALHSFGFFVVGLIS
jgi:hypothetical protein